MSDQVSQSFFSLFITVSLELLLLSKGPGELFILRLAEKGPCMQFLAQDRINIVEILCRILSFFFFENSCVIPFLLRNYENA